MKLVPQYLKNDVISDGINTIKIISHVINKDDIIYTGYLQDRLGKGQIIERNIIKVNGKKL